jgi:hypothetical protein
MPRRGKGAAGFLPLFGGLCLVLGLGFVVIGGIDHAPAARLVAAAEPAVAEVVWSRDCRDRHGKERRRRTGVAVADSDGTG